MSESMRTCRYCHQTGIRCGPMVHANGSRSWWCHKYGGRPVPPKSRAEVSALSGAA